MVWIVERVRLHEMVHFGEKLDLLGQVELLQGERVVVLHLHAELFVGQLPVQKHLDLGRRLMDAVHAAQEHGRGVGVALQRVDVEPEPLGVHFVERGERVELPHACVVLSDFLGAFLQVAFERQVVFGVGGVFLVFEPFLQPGDHHRQFVPVFVFEFVFTDGPDPALDLVEQGCDFHFFLRVIRNVVIAHQGCDITHFDDGGIDDLQLLLRVEHVVDQLEVVFNGVRGLQQLGLAAAQEQDVLREEVVLGDRHQPERAVEALPHFLFEAQVQRGQVQLQEPALELVAQFLVELSRHLLLLGDAAAERLHFVLGFSDQHLVDVLQVVLALVLPVELAVVEVLQLFEHALVAVEERVDVLLHLPDPGESEQDGRGVEHGFVEGHVLYGVGLRGAQRAPELPEVARAREGREEQQRAERGQQRVLEQPLEAAQVGVDADRLGRHVPVRGVHGLRDLVLLHLLDQQLRHEHLERGREAEVFGLEVRVRDVLELPFEDVVGFAAPLDVVAFVE